MKPILVCLLLITMCLTHIITTSNADWSARSSYCQDTRVEVVECGVGSGVALVYYECVDEATHAVDYTGKACQNKIQPPRQIKPCDAPIYKSTTSPPYYKRCDEVMKFQSVSLGEDITVSWSQGALLRRGHFQGQIQATYDEAITEQISAMGSNPIFQENLVDSHSALYDLSTTDVYQQDRHTHVQQQTNESHTTHSTHSAQLFHEQEFRLDSSTLPAPVFQIWSLTYNRPIGSSQPSWQAKNFGAGPLQQCIGGNFIAVDNVDPDDITRLNMFTIGGAQLTTTSSTNTPLAMSNSPLSFSTLRQTCSAAGANTCLQDIDNWTAFGIPTVIPARMNALMIEISPSFFYWIGGFGENNNYFNDVYSLNFHDSHGRLSSRAEYGDLGVAPFSPRSSMAGGFLRHANEGTKFRGRVLIVGGATAQGINNQIWLGDLDYNGYLHWRAQPLSNFDVALSQRSHAAFVVDRNSQTDTLFIAGGFSSNQQMLKDVWKISSDLSISKLSDLSAPRWGGSLLYFDHQLVYMGGLTTYPSNDPQLQFALTAPPDHDKLLFAYYIADDQYSPDITTIVDGDRCYVTASVLHF